MPSYKKNVYLINIFHEWILEDNKSIFGMSKSVALKTSTAFLAVALDAESHDSRGTATENMAMQVRNKGCEILANEGSIQRSMESFLLL